MAEVHLYGKDYETYEKETVAPVEKDSLIGSKATAVLLQAVDRKSAIVAFVGTGGETYLLGNATRARDDLAEHLRAFLTVVEAGKH